MNESDTDVAVGTIFADRVALAEAGLHRQRQAGIASTKVEGAYSIVLSGGYEDDEDHGSVIIYTGEGGRDERTGRQIADQKLNRGNKALAISKLKNNPINVIRGYKHKSPFSPVTGYQYAGKYYITDYWHEIGKSGFVIYRFRLEAENIQNSATTEDVISIPASERRIYTSLRLIRDTQQAKAVKELYQYKCQVCDIAIELPLDQLYAEGAHIKPLGRPHDGPDDISNLLCLCPNHHVMFDNYVYSINPNDYSLTGALKGKLTVDSRHALNRDNIVYHNELFNTKNK